MKLINKVLSILPEPLRYTFMLRAFGFFQVPLIFAVRPSVVCLDDKQSIIKIACRRKVKNHLNSIYFGALAIAAECAGGLAVMKEIEASGQKISLVFKDFHADFLKRAEGETYFSCSDVGAIKEFVNKVKTSSERMEMPFDVVASCPDKFGDEVIATFRITVSLKKKS